MRLSLYGSLASSDPCEGPSKWFGQGDLGKTGKTGKTERLLKRAAHGRGLGHAVAWATLPDDM